MTREWKPGDVARINEDEIALCVRSGILGGSRDEGVHWIVATGQELWSSVKDARPLAVIDLSDTPSPLDRAGRTEAKRLVDMLREAAEDFFVPDAAELARKVADQIEAQIEPPKLEEPTGLGAVVVDADGNEWVRHERVALAHMHWRPVGGNTVAKWSAIHAVKVLSEGVQP